MLNTGMCFSNSPESVSSLGYLTWANTEPRSLKTNLFMYSCNIKAFEIKSFLKTLLDDFRFILVTWGELTFLTPFKIITIITVLLHLMCIWYLWKKNPKNKTNHMLLTVSLLHSHLASHLLFSYFSLLNLHFPVLSLFMCIFHNLNLHCLFHSSPLFSVCHTCLFLEVLPQVLAVSYFLIVFTLFEKAALSSSG